MYVLERCCFIPMLYVVMGRFFVFFLPMFHNFFFFSYLFLNIVYMATAEGYRTCRM